MNFKIVEYMSNASIKGDINTNLIKFSQNSKKIIQIGFDPLSCLIYLLSNETSKIDILTSKYTIDEDKKYKYLKNLFYDRIRIQYGDIDLHILHTIHSSMKYDLIHVTKDVATYATILKLNFVKGNHHVLIIDNIENVILQKLKGKIHKIFDIFYEFCEIWYISL